MTIGDFWNRISMFVEYAPFCCSFCPVDKYKKTVDKNYETGCEKGCAFALKLLYDRLERDRVIYR